jgi:predicted amidophosphoribosyltransferase
MCGRNFGNLLIPALAGMLVAETMTPPQAVARQAGPQAVCPQCKTAVSPAFGWCPQCGQALRVQSAQIQSCAYCGQTMTSGAQYCASCGAPAGKR